MTDHQPPNTTAADMNPQTIGHETDPPTSSPSGQNAAALADADTAPTLPRRGMVITILTREDVVVTDPDRLLAAARRAYQADNPDATNDEATTTIADLTDAVFALLDRYGAAASEHPDVAAGATPRRRMHGGTGYLPGDDVTDRPDGLSPAGTVHMIVFDEPRTLQSYGCFLPEFADLFTGPAHRSSSTHG